MTSEGPQANEPGTPAGDTVTAQGLHPAALGLIENYLGQLASALGRPDRTTRDIIAELRDGLLAAAQRHVAGGLSGIEAARIAVRQCGAVEQLAPAMRADAIATRARATARALLRTGPLAAAAWAATVVIGPASPWLVGAASPWRTVLPWLGLGVLVTLACSLLAGTAGSGTAHESPRVARGAAIAAAVACAVTDLAGLTCIAILAVTAPGAMAWPVGAAIAVSGARTVLAGHSVHRLRHSLVA
jgi:hypothetical protein